VRAVAPGGTTRGSTTANTTTRVARAISIAVAVLLAATGLAATEPAQAASITVSTRYLVRYLPAAGEHVDGYDRTKFRLWVDADHDGCDTRDEVLIAEAVTKPGVGPGCTLRGGTWRSRYDGIRTSDPSTFDVDHMVPLDEAWQSGAWQWSPEKRQAYANDLGYKASLIAVTASSNRSKGDREPQDWMPARSGYQCAYVKRWVAVKWRWQLHVDSAERGWLTAELRACGWPRVVKPAFPHIPSSSSASSSSGGSGGPSAGAGSSQVSYYVHPGAFCSEHWRYGRTSAGTLMRCTTTSTDTRFRWRSA
jgi:hypothetical protein